MICENRNRNKLCNQKNYEISTSAQIKSAAVSSRRTAKTTQLWSNHDRRFWKADQNRRRNWSRLRFTHKHLPRRRRCAEIPWTGTHRIERNLFADSVSIRSRTSFVPRNSGGVCGFGETRNSAGFNLVRRARRSASAKIRNRVSYRNYHKSADNRRGEIGVSRKIWNSRRNSRKHRADDSSRRTSRRCPADENQSSAGLCFRRT